MWLGIAHIEQFEDGFHSRQIHYEYEQWGSYYTILAIFALYITSDSVTFYDIAMELFVVHSWSRLLLWDVSVCCLFL